MRRIRGGRKAKPLDVAEAAHLAHVRMLGTVLTFGRLAETLAEEVFLPFLAVGLYRIDAGRLYVVIKMNREVLVSYEFPDHNPAIQVYLHKMDEMMRAYALI